MKQSDVEAKWSRDRKNLVECRGRHEGLKKFYETRDKAITSGGPAQS